MCLEAADEMSKKGISVEVIDLRTIKPLDIATVAQSVRKTNRCVLVEEGHVFGGINAEVGFLIQQHCFDFLDAPIQRVAQKETPMPYSKVLEKETLPSVPKILAVINSCINR
jgi:pyruvate dehydrogenase E1 component beta subunit